MVPAVTTYREAKKRVHLSMMANLRSLDEKVYQELRAEQATCCKISIFLTRCTQKFQTSIEHLHSKLAIEVDDELIENGVSLDQFAAIVGG